jgi:hypothetical protein
MRHYLSDKNAQAMAILHKAPEFRSFSAMCFNSGCGGGRWAVEVADSNGWTIRLRPSAEAACSVAHGQWN